MKMLRFALVILILLSYAAPALATPLTGANADVSYYTCYCSGGQNEDTTDANDAGGSGDVFWPTSGGDTGAYIGSTSKFSAVYVDINNAAYGAGGGAAAMNVYYYNGSNWSTSISHSGNIFHLTGIQSFSFTAPSDWATTSLSTEGPYYYIKIEAAGVQGINVVNQISLLTETAAVPEFSTMMFITTILVAGTFVVTKLTKLDGSARLAV